jgi:hypothetical protein
VIEKDFLDSRYSSKTYYGYFFISDQVSLLNVGRSTSNLPYSQGIDLVMLVPYLSDQACLAINSMAGVNSIPDHNTRIADVHGGRNFKGWYWSLNGGYTLQPRVTPEYGCMWGDINDGGISKVNVGYFLLLAR